MAACKRENNNLLIFKIKTVLLCTNLTNIGGKKSLVYFVFSIALLGFQGGVGMWGMVVFAELRAVSVRLLVLEKKGLSSDTETSGGLPDK